MFDRGVEGSVGDNSDGLLGVEDAFRFTDETFCSDASIHSLLHGVSKEHLILDMLNS